MATKNRQETLDEFRDAILATLDRIAQEHFGVDHGWQDKDLPELFKAVDSQVDRLAERNSVTLMSHEEG